MKVLKKILFNRNTILIFATISGLLIGDYSIYLKKYTLYILGVIMIFSTTGIKLSSLNNFKEVSKSLFVSLLLNYLIYGTVILVLAFLLFEDREIINGFIVIAATPPGIAIIPFSFILKGNLKFSLIGLLSTYLISILLTPLILTIFIKDAEINILSLLMTTVQVIIIPILLSRLLLFKKILPVVEKVRGKIVDWGFALIIYTAVGLNRAIIFSDWTISLKSVIIMGVTMFGLGFLYDKISPTFIKDKTLRISHNLMLTIKSSGFAAATSIFLFGQKAAIPSAFLSIFVVLYLLKLGFKK